MIFDALIYFNKHKLLTYKRYKKTGKRIFRKIFEFGVQLSARTIVKKPQF